MILLHYFVPSMITLMYISSLRNSIMFCDKMLNLKSSNSWQKKIINLVFLMDYKRKHGIISIKITCFWRISSQKNIIKTNLTFFNNITKMFIKSNIKTNIIKRSKKNDYDKYFTHSLLYYVFIGMIVHWKSSSFVWIFIRNIGACNFTSFLFYS